MRKYQKKLTMSICRTTWRILHLSLNRSILNSRKRRKKNFLSKCRLRTEINASQRFVTSLMKDAQTFATRSLSVATDAKEIPKNLNACLAYMLTVVRPLVTLMASMRMSCAPSATLLSLAQKHALDYLVVTFSTRTVSFSFFSTDGPLLE